MHQSRLKLLFGKYIDNSIHEDEYYELLVFISNSENKNEIIEIIQDEFIVYKETNEGKILSKSTDEIFKEITERAPVYQDEKDDANAPAPQKYILRFFVKLSAAAVIIGFVILATVTFDRSISSNKNITTTVKQHKKLLSNNILPATNAAVLTLAGGKQIILDTIHAGIIAQQGVSEIVNASGKLKLSKKNNISAEVVYNTLSTHRANQYQISLSDGTKVWLNAASSLTFPNIFKGKERTVTITGEAYFEVVKNPLQPFIVNVNGVAVKVFGTHFNIDAYDTGKIRTVLLEGSVQVTSGVHRTFITPGEAADATNRALDVHRANLQKAVAWKDGEFYFEKDQLSDIMKEVARWYDIDVRYEGEISNSYSRYSGSFTRSAKLPDVLQMLENVSNAEFTIVDRTVIVRL